MAYTKRNFSDGSILYASDLNAMDDQIALNEQAAVPKKFKKLHTETADGTKNFVRFTADDDGNPFEVEELVMYATIPAVDYNVRFSLYLQNSAGTWQTAKADTPGALQNATAARYTETCWYNRTGDRWQCDCTTSSAGGVGSVAYRSPGDAFSEVGTVTSIKAVLMYIYGTDVLIPAGTTFEFWGR